MAWIKGSDLNAEQRKLVLSVFVHRWTTGNTQRTQVYKCELCDIRNPYVNTQSANNHTHPTIPLISDDEWLKQYAFDFNANGTNLSKTNHCDRVYLHFQED